MIERFLIHEPDHLDLSLFVFGSVEEALRLVVGIKLEELIPLAHPLQYACLHGVMAVLLRHPILELPYAA